MSNNNNTSSPTDSSSPKQFGGFAIAFGISMGGLSVIAIMIIASYVCTRKPRPTAGHDGSLSTDDQDSVIIAIGLDEATLNTYPKLPYSEAKRENGDSIPSCCSICLAEYVDSDSLRVLPDCDHLFHVECIDPWLKLHPTCPICRNLPVSQSPSNDHDLPRERAAPTRRVFFDTWFVQFMH